MWLYKVTTFPNSCNVCKDLQSAGISINFVENDETMSDLERIQLFENKKVRTAWDEEKQEWFFSIVDVCGILTDQPTHERARNYWKVLKNRLKKEGSEVVTKCNRLKLIAEDGKPRDTDVADMAVMFRVIESIPSKKAATPCWSYCPEGSPLSGLCTSCIHALSGRSMFWTSGLLKRRSLLL